MTNAPSAVIVFKQILNNKNDEEFYKSSAPGFGIMNDKTGGEKTVKKRLLLLLICMLFLLSGYTAEAAKNEEKTTYLFAMDTTMTIRVFGGDDALMQSLQKRVNEIENQVSVTREYSDIYRLNWMSPFIRSFGSGGSQRGSTVFRARRNWKNFLPLSITKKWNLLRMAIIFRTEWL